MFGKRTSIDDHEDKPESGSDPVGPADIGRAKPLPSAFLKKNRFKLVSVFAAVIMLLICVAPAVSFGIDPKAPAKVSAEEDDDDDEEKGPIYDPYPDWGTRENGSDPSHETEVPDGWIGIYSVEDLAKIGVDSGYPLSGSYIQMGDVDFTQASAEYLATRGYEIKVTATIDSTQIVFQIQYRANGSTGAWTNAANTSLTYSFGKVTPTTASTNASGQFTISNANSGYGTPGYTDLIFVIWGTMNGGNFTFSIDVHEGMTSGVLSKESYQKGNFDPIGNNSNDTSATRFTGKYNGNNYVIKGLEIAVYSANVPGYAGLFGYAENAEISNIGILATQKGTKGIWGSTNGMNLGYAGAIVGCAISSTSIKNCYNTGSVIGGSYAGGIAGFTFPAATSIIDCHNTGAVYSSSSTTGYAGGIAGSGTSLIDNCYNTGSVAVSSSGMSYAGGINGYSSKDITNCYNTGSVTISTINGIAYSGGIVGWISSSVLSNCYNTGSISASASSAAAQAGGIAGYSFVQIDNTYNIGSVTASSSSGAQAGGISGNNGKSLSISNSFFLNTSASSGVGGGAAGGTSKTFEELKQQTTFTNWDFTNKWGISSVINDGYPYLQTFGVTEVVIVEHPQSQSAHDELYRYCA